MLAFLADYLRKSSTQNFTRNQLTLHISLPNGKTGTIVATLSGGIANVLCNQIRFVLSATPSCNVIRGYATTPNVKSAIQFRLRERVIMGFKTKKVGAIQ